MAETPASTPVKEPAKSTVQAPKEKPVQEKPKVEVKAVVNHHYFKTLKLIMTNHNTNMIIDGADDLWHELDIARLLIQYEPAVKEGC
mgnify:CR=1 FL=1